jgi:hypothetical protein
MLDRINIYRDGKSVAYGKDLRCILTYARKSPVVSVDCSEDIGHGYYNVTFTFSDGAKALTTWASWTVLVHWIMARRSWTTNRWTGARMFTDVMELAIWGESLT